MDCAHSSHGGNHDTGQPVRIHMNNCEHGEPFACLSDVIAWIDRIECHATVYRDMRDYISRELALMSLSYDMEEL